MAKIFQFPGANQVQVPDGLEAGIVDPVPAEFRKKYDRVVRGSGQLEIAPNALRQFFLQVIEWCSIEMGIKVSLQQKEWFAGMLTRFKNAIGENNDTVMELMLQAILTRRGLERTMMLEEVGNRSLMAAGGLVATRRPDHIHPSYYVDQATAAYGSVVAQNCHPILASIVYDERVPDLALIARVIRYIASALPLGSLHDFMEENTRASKTPPPSLRIIK